MKFKHNITAKKYKKGGRKLLSERIVLLVQILYARGLTMRGAAARAGIALGSVHKILSGSHPNQTRPLSEIKKEESLKLYRRLCAKRRGLRALLPDFRKIDWMRMKGRVLLVDRIIAQRVNGVLTPAEWVMAGKAAA